ncbi:MAG: hypothetical protein AAFZ09_02585, partial [Pseudomonadota bacterium]
MGVALAGVVLAAGPGGADDHGTCPADDLRRFSELAPMLAGVEARDPVLSVDLIRTETPPCEAVWLVEILDGDEIVNVLDPDVDGDTIPNVDDAFSYDADNGVLIAEGEMIELTFDIDGTPYQNGLTGLLQGAAGGFEEDTGTAVVENGKLLVTANNGDTGGQNNPSDDFQIGVKNANFTVEARIDNPF